MKATQTMAMEQNNSACYISSLCAPALSFFCPSNFFLFFFSIFFFQLGAQENEPRKVAQQLDVSSDL
jgi:hypothetical protein